MTKTSSDARLTAFRDKRIKHRSIERALDALLCTLKQPRPESVMVLTGPSGVGKSTIVEKVEKHLRIIHAQRMIENPGVLPYISIRGQTPLDGHFNWKDMFTRAMSSAAEILIDQKFSPRFDLELDGRRMDTMKGMVREELRRAFESLVRNRAVPVILIDEASALLRLKRGAIPFLQFEILKSLAVELKIPIVLVGAYDLLEILEGNGQLLRRSQIIHCQRYRAGTEFGGVDTDFIDALHALLSAIGMPYEPDLDQHYDMFYMKSIGCIGVLKDWLDRALQAALFESECNPVLTRRHLEAAALPNNELRRLVKEAQVGELRLLQQDDEKLARDLNLDYTPSFYLSPPSITSVENSKSTADRQKPNFKGGRRRGLRGPGRDSIGDRNA